MQAVSFCLYFAANKPSCRGYRGDSSPGNHSRIYCQSHKFPRGINPQTLMYVYIKIVCLCMHVYDCPSKDRYLLRLILLQITLTQKALNPAGNSNTTKWIVLMWHYLKKSRARQHLFLQLGMWCQGFRDSLHSGLTREWGAQLLPGALPVCWSNKPPDPCCSASPPCLYPLSLVLSRAILTLKIQKCEPGSCGIV